MAIALGIQSKRQVYLAAGLVTVVVVLAGWEIYGALAHRSPQASLRSSVPVRAEASAKQTKTTNRTWMGFHLRIDELTRSENLDYSADGKDVFAAAPVAPPIETVVAPPRPAVALAPPPPPAPAGPPPMDLKYLGFAESDPGKLSALFMHGDEIYVAKSGDIMFHRFKVGSIQESNAQVTDLISNNTQNIGIATN